MGLLFKRIQAFLFVFVAIPAYAQQIKIVASTPNTNLYAIRFVEANFVGRIQTDTVFIGIDSCVYKKNTEQLLILQKSKGYRNKTQLIDDKWVSKNKKRIQLFPLETIPLSKEKDSKLFVNEVNFYVKNKHFKTKFYESYSDFINGELDHTSTLDENIEIENSRLSLVANEFLVENKYLDTSSSQQINLNIYDKVDFSIAIEDVVFYEFGQYCQLELTCSVKFDQIYLKGGKFEKNYKIQTNIGSNYQDAKLYLFIDGMEQLLVKLLKDEELSPVLRNVEESFKAQLELLKPIELNNQTNQPYTLEEAVKSVVTIKLKDGHGSGCIISKDGYILTNFHVAGGDSSDLMVLFNDGSSKKAHFIRGNPLYDLALIQVDSVFNTPLQISLKPVGLGSDVYAIGTPKDINLGQTITKGIVSARRKFSDKVYIQSDVSVNGGNSGGAMVDKNGYLIGIVNAKLVGLGVEGVSFAIPIDLAEQALKIKWK